MGAWYERAVNAAALLRWHRGFNILDLRNLRQLLTFTLQEGGESVDWESPLRS